jgi:hypothetical protein
VAMPRLVVVSGYGPQLEGASVTNTPFGSMVALMIMVVRASAIATFCTVTGLGHVGLLDSNGVQ